MERQIVMDTETTGIETSLGHRIIEIGCVELIDRRPIGQRYHRYLNPERAIDSDAMKIHGITNERVKNEPKFAEIADELIEFLRGAELIIHNAPFDVGFLNAELRRAKSPVKKIEDIATITDTLVLARKLHPGQRNTLDALCNRYQVDNSAREYHGALLDSLILADVYIAMTSGQVSLMLTEEDSQPKGCTGDKGKFSLPADRPPLLRIAAQEHELEAHEAILLKLDKKAKGQCLWREVEPLWKIDNPHQAQQINKEQ